MMEDNETLNLKLYKTDKVLDSEYSLDCEKLNSNTIKYKIIGPNKKFLSFYQVFNLWKSDASFGSFFTIAIIASNSLPNIFFETRSVTKSSANDDFEFVLIGTNSFENIPVDEDSFKQYFKSKKDLVLNFKNLGRDATLIVPNPPEFYKSDQNIPQFYKNLKNFLKFATRKQVEYFWYEVGKQALLNLSSNKMYINTSGQGVYYLHLRLDSSPKYYQFGEYRNS